MRIVGLVAVLLWLPAAVSGQSLSVDASVGRSGSSWRASGSAMWQLTLARRISLGAGPRLTWFGGEAKSYRTHDQRPAGLDSRIDIAPKVLALNLAVSGEVALLGPVGVGANLDLAGVAFGPERSAGGARLAPAHGSLFQYGDNDRGSLNSEFYGTFRVGRGLRIRAGASHYVTGYRLVAGSNRPRYLRFDTVPFVALRLGL